jgi:hypothetical protein
LKSDRDKYVLYSKNKSKSGAEKIAISSDALVKNDQEVFLDSVWTGIGELEAPKNGFVALETRQLSYQNALGHLFSDAPFERKYLENDKTGDASGLWWPIEKLTKGEMYILSFEYKTGNVPARVEVYENNQRSDGAPKLVLSDWIYAKEQMPYAVVIRSEFGEEGYVHIAGGEPEKNSELIVKAVSFRHILAPDFYGVPVAGRRLDPSESLFGYRVSPVTYIYDAPTHAQSYILALNAQYNARWSLASVDATDTYLLWLKGASMPETLKQLLYSFVGAFDSKIKISEHFSVNGNMNGWYVKENTISRDRQYLVLQYEPQRYFIAGLVVSIVFFICLSIYVFIASVKTFILHA